MILMKFEGVCAELDIRKFRKIILDAVLYKNNFFECFIKLKLNYS